MQAARGGGGGFSALAVKDKKKSSKDKEGKDKDKDKVRHYQRNVLHLLTQFYPNPPHCTVLCLASALHKQCCGFHLSFFLSICCEVLHPPFIKCFFHPQKYYFLLCSRLFLTILFFFMMPYYRNPKIKIKIRRGKRAVSSPLRARKNLPPPPLLPRKRAATR